MQSEIIHQHPPFYPPLAFYAETDNHSFAIFPQSRAEWNQGQRLPLESCLNLPLLIHSSYTAFSWSISWVTCRFLFFMSDNTRSCLFLPSLPHTTGNHHYSQRIQFCTTILLFEKRYCVFGPPLGDFALNELGGRWRQGKAHRSCQTFRVSQDSHCLFSLFPLPHQQSIFLLCLSLSAIDSHLPSGPSFSYFSHHQEKGSTSVAAVLERAFSVCVQVCEMSAFEVLPADVEIIANNNYLSLKVSFILPFKKIRTIKNMEGCAMESIEIWCGLYKQTILMSFDKDSINTFIEKIYWQSYVPSLQHFIAIPNTSRLYDPQWYTNGLLEQAGRHIQSWVEELNIKGLKSELIKLQGFSPLLFVEVEGQSDHTILYYGHFDKQPHMGGWDEDKGPTKPVIIDNCLYGRGGGDDGYAAYSSMLAVKAVQQQGIPLPRIVMIIEGDEQSGNHIQTYFAHLRQRLGKVDVVYCFDSEVSDYDRLWITKSIRGYVDFEVSIKILKEGVHSGDASGIVPSTFRISSLMLNRLQDLQTGKVNSFFNVDIPSQRYSEMHNVTQLFKLQPYQARKTEGLQFLSENALQLELNSTWRPQMTVIGLNGLPEVARAGNVMLPQLRFKVNMRMPPTFDSSSAPSFIQKLLTTDTPFGCQVSVQNFDTAPGWNCNKYESWLEEALNSASQTYFKSNAYSLSMGGSIPIISILGKEYAHAQIIVTGVLGPKTNAHGPNEHIDLGYTLKFTQAVAHALASTALHYAK